MPMCDEEVARRRLWEEVLRVLPYDSGLTWDDMMSDLACMVSFYCGLKEGERSQSSTPTAKGVGK